MTTSELILIQLCQMLIVRFTPTGRATVEKSLPLRIPYDDDDDDDDGRVPV